MDAQIDHVTGLLMLRERRTPLPLLATPEVFSDIGSGFPITGILSHYCGVDRHELPIDGSAVDLPALPGLQVQTISLSSKPPPYSPFRGNPRPGDNIGLLITNPVTSAKAFYAPGLAEVTPELIELMSGCAVVLVDGTFWTHDEMQRLGLSTKAALDMGHLPQSGPGGMIEQLDPLARRRAQDPHPHQQHQPHAGGRLRRTRRTHGPRHRGRPRRHGHHVLNTPAPWKSPKPSAPTATCPPGAPLSSKPSCATRAAVTTSTTRSTCA